MLIFNTSNICPWDHFILMKLWFTNSFTPNGHILVKLCSRVQHLIVHHTKYFIFLPKKNQLSFIDTATNANCHKVTNYIVKQSFICTLRLLLWNLLPSAANQWLQFDVGPPTLITGLVTKGRSDTRRKHWVTRFRVSYSNDSKVWYYYKDASHLDPKVGTLQELDILNIGVYLKCNRNPVNSLNWAKCDKICGTGIRINLLVTLLLRGKTVSSHTRGHTIKSFWWLIILLLKSLNSVKII